MVYRDTEKFFKKLTRKKEVEDAISRLDALTKEESVMTVARNLEATHRVDRNVEMTRVVTEDIDGNAKVTGALTEDIDNNVKVTETPTDNEEKVAETRVEDIDDNVESTEALIENVDDNVKVTKNISEDIDDNTKVTEALTGDIDGNVKVITHHVQPRKGTFPSAVDISRMHIKALTEDLGENVKATKDDATFSVHLHTHIDPPLCAKIVTDELKRLAFLHSVGFGHRS